MKKVFNRTVGKRVAVVVLGLLLAGLTAAAVYGYFQFKSLSDKVNSVDSKLTELTGSRGDESATDENNEETEEKGVVFTIDNKEIRTVRYSTTYDSVTQDYVYEPRQFLEVTLKADNESTRLYDSSSTRFFASTAQGKLVTDSSYSVHEDDKKGSVSVNLAPGGTGTVVLYFEIESDAFSSVFIDDSYNFGGTYTIQL